MMLAGCEDTTSTMQQTRRAWLDNGMTGDAGEIEVALSPTPRLYMASWPNGQEELKFAVAPKRIVPIGQWGPYEVYQLDGGPMSDLASFQILLEDGKSCYPLLTFVDVPRTYYSQATVEIVPDFPESGVQFYFPEPLPVFRGGPGSVSGTIELPEVRVKPPQEGYLAVTMPLEDGTERTRYFMQSNGDQYRGDIRLRAVTGPTSETSEP